MDARSERWARRLEVPALIAAVLVVPVLAIEGSDASDGVETLGTVLNWVSWLVFAVEAAVMLAVVPDRRRWIRDNPIDVAVVILTPPFLAALVPVRLLRLLSLLRLLRLAPMLRRTFSLEGLRYAAVLAALTAVAGGAAFSEIEHHSTADGMYWALSTMTTVGYGDLSPETDAGKALAVLVMLVGIGFVAVLTGAIAERFLAGDVQDEAEQVEAEIDETGAAIIGELRAIRTRLDDLEAAVHRRRG